MILQAFTSNPLVEMAKNPDGTIFDCSNLTGSQNS